MPTRSPCQDRKVVHVNNRLHSYDYDRAWYEFGPEDAQCYLGLCNPRAYSDWRKAAMRYIDESLRPHFLEIQQDTSDALGSLVPPAHIDKKFKEISEFLDEWDEITERPFEDGGLPEINNIRAGFWNPLRAFWNGKIIEVVKYFDDAACYFADLNDIAKGYSPGSVKKPRGRVAKTAPDGGSWLNRSDSDKGIGGGGGGGGGGISTNTALSAVGVIAIGGALYFGYKVLTE